MALYLPLFRRGSNWIGNLGMKRWYNTSVQSKVKAPVSFWQSFETKLTLLGSCVVTQILVTIYSKLEIKDLEYKKELQVRESQREVDRLQQEIATLKSSQQILLIPSPASQ